MRPVRIQNNKLKDAKMHFEVIILDSRRDRNTFSHRSDFLKNDSERFFQPVFGLRFHHSPNIHKGIWQISSLTYELLGLHVHLASVGRHYSSHKGCQGRTDHFLSVLEDRRRTRPPVVPPQKPSLHSCLKHLHTAQLNFC